MNRSVIFWVFFLKKNSQAAASAYAFSQFFLTRTLNFFHKRMPRTLEILDACFDQMMKTIMYKHKVVSGKRKQNLGAKSGETTQ